MAEQKPSGLLSIEDLVALGLDAEAVSELAPYVDGMSSGDLEFESDDVFDKQKYDEFVSLQWAEANNFLREILEPISLEGDFNDVDIDVITQLPEVQEMRDLIMDVNRMQQQLSDQAQLLEAILKETEKSDATN